MRMAPRQEFGLTLMVNHACNLRCTYCYTGKKFYCPMPLTTGRQAIDRALNSLAPGGRLDLGFFGGEPLLDADRIRDWMIYTRNKARDDDKKARFSLTTNGTVISAEAWQVITAADLELAVSFDAPPEAHDRHRRFTNGEGSAGQVEEVLRRLLRAGKNPCVVRVVRPDNLEEVPAGLVYLHALGVRHVELSLDIWAAWSSEDRQRLSLLAQRAADLWQQWLPAFSLNWFDTKVGQMAQLPSAESCSRCGFGAGEIAVAPSGRLYPCERLIGDDSPHHPLCLPGTIHAGQDFLEYAPPPFEPLAACARCGLQRACDTTCRCSNYVRTGDVNRPDGLLCLLNQATARAAAEALSAAALAQRFPCFNQRKSKSCYVKQTSKSR